MSGIRMRYLDINFAVAKLPVTDRNYQAAGRLLASSYVFVTRTKDEISVIAENPRVMYSLETCKEIEIEDGWKCFEVIGPMPFNLVGIASKITGLLAEKGIPLLAQSTFDTDYFFVKKDKVDDAISALQEGGVEFNFVV